MADDFNAIWARLMIEAQGGSQESYENLLKELYPFLLGFVRKRSDNVPDTEEILQSVFLRIHISRHTYNPHYPLEPWLYTIARNCISDHHRSRIRAGIPSAYISEEAAIGEEDLTLETIALKRAIMNLPENQRVALELLQFTGLSAEDAAKKVGVSVSAIKVRAHRAYEALKHTDDDGSKKKISR